MFLLRLADELARQQVALIATLSLSMLANI